MTPSTIALLAASLGPVITVTGGLLLAKMLRPNELIDQLQEERGEVRRQITVLNRKVETLSFRQRYFEDYVNQLRDHISQGKGPPPPDYPQGLLRINMED